MKKDFRKWANRKMKGQDEVTVWPLWLRVVVGLLIVGLIVAAIVQVYLTP